MIFNMVGGGGGSLKNTDAVLIVSVPTGSTVTATKGGVTITPTIWVQNADNAYDTAIFIVKESTFDENAWTVTATLGADSASDTVVINSNKEFEIILDYTYYLFRNGQEYTSRTGGWEQKDWSSSYYTAGTFANEDGELKLKSNGSGPKMVGIVTANTIDVTDFGTLEWEITTRQFKGTHIGLATTQTQEPLSTLFSQDNLAVGTYTLDISGVTGSRYVCFRVLDTSAGASYVTAFNNILLR